MNRACILWRRLRIALGRAFTPRCIASGKHDWGASCEDCQPW